MKLKQHQLLVFLPTLKTLKHFKKKNKIIDLEGNIIKGWQRQMEPFPEDEINGYLYILK